VTYDGKIRTTGLDRGAVVENTLSLAIELPRVGCYLTEPTVALDLLFPVTGGPVPTDHLYPLYGALSRLVPAAHDPAAGVRFAPLTGDAVGRGQLALTARSHLRVRVPDDGVRLVLPLAGARLEVAGAAVRVGVPAVAAVVPAPTVAARVVTFKHPRHPVTPGRAAKRPAAPLPVSFAQVTDPEWFLETARRKLAALGVEGEPALPRIGAGPRAGEPRRRVVRIKGRAIVGYSLVVSGLSAAHSLALQSAGLGGRTRIGCGFFLPVRPEGV
jgi:hypothetical protein